MSLFIFLTVIQAIVAAALVGVVLMQRSEGGGLGMGGGGGPGGLMNARGAADFLTRTTKWLAVLFVGLAIILAALAVDTTSGRDIDASLDRGAAPVQDPLAPVSQPGAGLDQPVSAAPNLADPAQGSPDPLAGAAK